MKDKKIFLDIDGVCLDFATAFIEKCQKSNIHLTVGPVWNFFNDDIKSYDIFSNLTDEFWLSLERERKSFNLDFKPAGYISHRKCDTEISRFSLLKNNFPDAPVYHVKYTEDKVKIFNELGGDIFIDDRLSTVLYFRENGIKSYVLDQPWNRYFNDYRLKTLGELKELEGK